MVTTPDPAQEGVGGIHAAGELTLSTWSIPTTFATANRAPKKGTQVSYFPPVLKERVKVVKLNPEALEQQTRKWDCAMKGK